MTHHERQFGELSAALASSSKRGLPMILTGVLFWLVAGAAGFLDHTVTVWVYLYGIGVIFPVGLLVAKGMKLDMTAKGNPLGVLAGVVGGMQVLFAPIVILVLFQLPDYVPFAVGVLTGAHFLPFAVIFRSKAYVFQSVATVAVAAITGFALNDSTFLVTPFAVMIAYLVTCFWLARESKG